MKLHFTCKKEKETVSLGKRFGRILKPGDIVALTGDLGAGKTHFASGIGEALGVKEYITSPTFTILCEYEGRMPMYHFDLYRLENEEELFDTGFWEYADSEGVTVIEWPEIAMPLLKKGGRRNIYTVTITRRDDISPEYREIDVEGDGRLEELEDTVD